MRFRFNRVLHDPDELAGGAAPAAPEQPAVEPATPPASFTAPPAPAGTPGPAPWATDLATRFEDEAVRGQVDTYLRETWQPRMTKLEQEYAPARQLYSDLQEDPDVTLVEVAAQLYGDDDPDRVRALAAALGVELEDDEDPSTPEAAAAETPAALDPRLAELLDEREATQRQTEWDDAMASVRESQPDLIDDLYIPFVVTAEGDMEVALERYRQTVGPVEAQIAAQRAAGVAPAGAAPAPPAVVGTGGTGAGVAPPAVAKRYTSMSAALDDWMDEERGASAPPVVGSA